MYIVGIVLLGYEERAEDSHRQCKDARGQYVRLERTGRVLYWIPRITFNGDREDRQTSA